MQNVISPGVTAFHYKFHKPKSQLMLSATQPVIKTPGSLSAEERIYNYTESFDKLMLELSSSQFHTSCEKNLAKMFRAQKCVFWYLNEQEKNLYSPTYDIHVSIQTSLPGFVVQTKSVIKIRNQNSVPNGYQNDTRIAPNGSPQTFFPVASEESICGVVQLVRDPNSSGYEYTENEAIDFCMKKFSIYSNLIFKNISIYKRIVNLFAVNNKIDPTILLQEHFQCQFADIYQFDMLRKNVRVLEHETCTMRPIEEQFGGIIAYSANHRVNVNELDITQNKRYSKTHDIEYEGSFLCVQEEIVSHKIWVVVLRNKSTGEFTTADENLLMAILPIVVKTIKGFSEAKKTSNLDARQSDLYGLVTNIAEIQKTIVPIGRRIEESVKLLIEADCTIFFYFDEKYARFLSKFQQERPIATDIKFGLVSYIFARREVVYYKNPTENEHYNPKIDSFPGYENKCTIGVTVCDTRGKAIGVIMGIGNPAEQFDEDDKKLIAAFAIYSGITIENQLYQDASLKFVKIVQETVAKPNSENLATFVNGIMECAPIRRVTIYNTANTDDSSGCLNKLYHFGLPSQIGEGTLAENCLKTKQETIYDKAKLTENGFIVLNSNIITANHSIRALFGLKTPRPNNYVPTDEVRIIVRPLVDKNNMCVGVLEVEYLGKEDGIIIGITDAIQVLAFRHLKSLIQPASLVSDDVETASMSIIASQDKQHLFSLDFNAYILTEAEITRNIFALIESFGLIGNLSIDAIEMGGFLNNVMTLSGKHCCFVMDIVQGLSIMMKLSKYDTLTTKHSLLALFYALLFYELRPIDVLTLLTKYQITGCVEKSSKSSFINSVIKFRKGISMTNFMPLRQHALQILTSGEFDPTESESHRFMLFTIIGVVAVCFSTCRPQFNKNIFEVFYQEYCKFTESIDDQSTVLSTAVLPLFSILAKAAPPLASFTSNALSNSKRIH